MFSHPSRSILAIISLFILVTTSTASPVNYVVECGYPYLIENPPDDVKQLSWWELSLRDVIIFSLVAISPALIYPLELFFLIKMLLYFGYRHITDKTVLDNRMRLEIYSRIRDHPGTIAPVLAKDLDMNLGTVRYHIEMLQFTGKISSISNPGFIAFFENPESRSILERKLLAHMRNETKVKIFQFLKHSPDSSRQGIADHLGLSGPAVTWHMNQLMDDLIIVTIRDGKCIRHSLNPEAVPVLEKYLPEMIHGE